MVVTSCQVAVHVIVLAIHTGFIVDESINQSINQSIILHTLSQSRAASKATYSRRSTMVDGIDEGTIGCPDSTGNLYF